MNYKFKNDKMANVLFILQKEGQGGSEYTTIMGHTHWENTEMV